MTMIMLRNILIMIITTITKTTIKMMIAMMTKIVAANFPRSLLSLRVWERKGAVFVITFQYIWITQ